MLFINNNVSYSPFNMFKTNTSVVVDVCLNSTFSFIKWAEKLQIRLVCLNKNVTSLFLNIIKTASVRFIFKPNNLSVKISRMTTSSC